MKVIFDGLANEEFNDAVEYYEFQVKGLGKRFKEEIKRALRTIKRFPEIRELNPNPAEPQPKRD